MKFLDSIALDDSAQVRITSDGYLVAHPRVARIGVQSYKGFELGRRDMETVRVFRPEAEVFHKDAMGSLAHRPITVNHPPVMVDSKNWRKYTVGSMGDTITRDGEFVRVPALLMDDSAIRDVQAGKRELSVGYTADIDWTAGEHNGEKYDAVMRNIRGNHLAVVDTARGGPSLTIGDSDMKTILVDGLSVSLEDKDAQIVQRALDTLTKQAKDAMEEEEEEKKKREKSDALVATKDAEIATLKQNLADATNPAKLEAAARERVGVIAKGKAIMGDKLVSDGKTTAEIRKQVVGHKLGDTAKDWTDAQVDASFAALVADVRSGDPLADALSNNHGAPVNDATKAYDEYVRSLGTAWQPNAGRA